MQFGGSKQPLGVIYNTTMSRPDSALALAMLLGFEGKLEARVGAVAVNGAGLGAAMFADAVTRFYYVSGPPPNTNRLLPVGLAADGPMPADPPMVNTALARMDDKGEPTYRRVVRQISDTSEIPALLRNGITAQSEKNSVLILSAPATYLARSLALPGTRELAAFRVKTLVVVDAPGPAQDAAALRKVLELWPTQVIFCGRDIGETLKFPGSAIEKDFAWAPAHPVADAYRAFGQMPYDAPGWDLAAMLYAVHPEHFNLSDPGMLTVGDEGRIDFAASADGKHRALAVDPAKRDAIVETFVAIASAKPVVRTPGNRRPAAEAVAKTPVAAPVATPPATPPAATGNKDDKK